MSAAASSSTSFRREATTTRTPCAAKASANARPIPVPPPVTSATCSAKGFIRRAIAVRPPELRSRRSENYLSTKSHEPTRTEAREVLRLRFVPFRVISWINSSPPPDLACPDSASALDEYARRARGHRQFNPAALDARLAAEGFEAVFETRAVFEARLRHAAPQGRPPRVVV